MKNTYIFCKYISKISDSEENLISYEIFLLMKVLKKVTKSIFLLFFKNEIVYNIVLKLFGKIL